MEEIELKFSITPHQQKTLLEELFHKGYISSGRKYEKTVMFDNGQSIMQTTDGRIRLRTSGDTYELSYKKPITREGIKKEIEYEVEVSDFETTQKILEMMEFLPTTSYERYRTTLKNESGDMKVTIDEFPFDTFLEIEGPEEQIVQLAGELFLSLDANLTDSCDSLFQGWRAKKGLGFKPHMLFADYDK